MNKTEAAQYLGVSVRAVERYAAAGRIAARYERGKTGQVLVFDQDELQRFKTELETPQPKPRQEPSRALAKFGGAGPEYSSAGAIELLSRMMDAAQAGTASSDKARLSVPVESKLLLTLEEARALTGLSREVLRSAIEAKKLKAQIIGRGWKIKRADLDTYIGKL